MHQWTADTITKRLRGFQTIRVEGQTYGQMFEVVEKYSAQQDHFAQQLPRKVPAVVGINFSPKTFLLSLIGYFLML